MWIEISDRYGSIWASDRFPDVKMTENTKGVIKFILNTFCLFFFVFFIKESFEKAIYSNHQLTLEKHIEIKLTGYWAISPRIILESLRSQRPPIWEHLHYMDPSNIWKEVGRIILMLSSTHTLTDRVKSDVSYYTNFLDFVL